MATVNAVTPAIALVIRARMRLLLQRVFSTSLPQSSRIASGWRSARLGNEDLLERGREPVVAGVIVGALACINLAKTLMALIRRDSINDADRSHGAGMCAMFRLFGPLSLDLADGAAELGPAKQRLVLAALLADAGRLVTVSDLVHRVWGAEAPAKADNAVYSYVSRLRRVLNRAAAPGERPLLVSRTGGYVLQIDPDRVDLHRFLRLTAAAATAPGDGRQAELLREALGLWRGEPLADLPGGWAARTREGWRQRHLDACVAWANVEVRLGSSTTVIRPLTDLVAEYPLVEPLVAALMRALHDAGRTAEALDCYAKTRRRLAAELGAEPGRELQAVHLTMLRERPTAVAAGGASAKRVPNMVPAQLPPDVAGFTGRVAALDLLDTMLPDASYPTAPGAITAIVGTAGVGKTALALHWAHRAASGYPDGQLHINLRGYAPGTPVSPLVALGTFLRSLGARPEEVPVDLDEATAMYRSLSAGRRMLVLLDNAKSVEQVRPLLPASPGCLVLVTSRDRLGGLIAREGARRLTLDPFTPDEARTLLTRILGEDRVRAEVDAAAELGVACAYLPLALRIAAANLIDHRHRTIAHHVALLREGNPLATFTVGGDEESAVRSALELSYETVPQDAQRLFRLLGLVPGADFTAAVAAALTARTADVTAPLLDQLAAAHLIQECSADRYTFHDLLRRYARERAMVDAERAAAVQRLFKWYLGTADAATRTLYRHVTLLPLPADDPPTMVPSFAGCAAALEWLDSEYRNLVAAVHHASDHGLPDMAWLIADRLRGYQSRRCHLVDWVAVAEAGLAAAETANDLTGQAAMRNGLGHANHWLCRHEEATEHLTQAMRLSLQSDWWQGYSTAVANLGNVKQQLGRLVEAVDHHKEALHLRSRYGRWGRAIALNNLGSDYLLMGELLRAEECLTEARELYREVGGNTSATLELLARTNHYLGHFDEALAMFTQAMALRQEGGDRYGVACNLMNMASLLSDMNRHQEGLALVETSLSVSREIRQRWAEADGLHVLASILEALGKHNEAIRYYEEALAGVDRTDAPYTWTLAMCGLASAHERLGHHDVALDHVQQALDLARQCTYRILEGRAQTILARIYLTAGHHDMARKYAYQALDNHRQTGYRMGETQTLVVLREASSRPEVRSRGDRGRVPAGQS